MQTDARLIEDIEHAHQPGANLRCQTNALGLAARKRPGAAAQRQIIQAYIDQKLQSGLDLLDDLTRDHFVLFAERDAVDEIQCLAD